MQSELRNQFYGVKSKEISAGASTNKGAKWGLHRLSPTCGQSPTHLWAEPGASPSWPHPEPACDLCTHSRSHIPTTLWDIPILQTFLVPASWKQTPFPEWVLHSRTRFSRRGAEGRQEWKVRGLPRGNRQTYPLTTESRLRQALGCNS